MTLQRVSPKLINPSLVLLAATAGLAMAGFPLSTLVIALSVAVVVIGVLIEPAVGLIVTLTLGPWAAWQNTYLPGLLPVDVGQLGVALTLGAWGVRGLVRREFNLPNMPLLAPLTIFVGWAAVTLLWAPDYAFGLREVIQWVELILIALFAFDVAQRRGAMWIVAGLLLSAVVQALVGLYEARIRGAGPEGFLLSEGVYRAYGSFEQPNPFAGFIGLNLPLAIGLMWAFWQRIWTRINTENTDSKNNSVFIRVHTCTAPAVHRRCRCLRPFLLASWVTAIVALLALALYLSFSRGAWLGAAAALLMMGLFLPRRRWIGAGLIGGLSVAGLALYAAGLLPASISERFADVGGLADVRDVRGAKINDANYAVIERLAHWQAALRMIEARPWTGVGFSNYQPVYEQYRLLNWPMPLGHAHNLYLNVAAETGLPGLAAYLFLWGAIFWQTIRALRTPSGVTRGLALGLLGAWVHLSVHHLFDNLYVDNVHLNIGAMIGLLGALATPSREKPHVTR